MLPIFHLLVLASPKVQRFQLQEKPLEYDVGLVEENMGMVLLEYVATKYLD